MDSFTNTLKQPGLLLGVSLLAGCQHMPLGNDPRPPSRPPEERVAYYHANGDPIRPVAVRDGEDAVLSRPSFTRTVYEWMPDDPDTWFDPWVFEHYVPHVQSGWPSPAVIVPEFLAGRMPEWVAEMFLDEGWHVLVLRWPEDLLIPDKDPAQLEATFRELVQNTRRSIDWLVRQPGVDAERLGTFGVSLGAIVNVILAAVDRDEAGEPRLLCHALAMAGQNLPAILGECTDGRVRDYVSGRARHSGETLEQLQESMRWAMTTEPGDLAPYVDPRKVLMFLARYDDVVPVEYGWQLRESLGNPETWHVPFGHYTFALTQVPVPWLETELRRYFRRHFESPESPATPIREWDHVAGMPAPASGAHRSD